jgi:SAM-dependent methyltransferase
MKCLLCSNTDIEKIHENDALYVVRDVNYCHTCEVFFVEPMPTDKELVKFYQNQWAWDHGMKKNSSFVRRMFHFIYEMHQKFVASDRAKHLIKILPNRQANIIEIGSGNGAFVKRIAKFFGKVEGIEPSIEQDYVGDDISIKKQAINAQVKMSKEYDAICMYMVLEHLNNPIDTIKNLTKYLKQKGILIVEVPYSPYQEFQGMDKFDRDKVFNNVHLFHYSKKNVALLANRVDMELAEFMVFRKKELIKGYNVFSVYPGSSKENLIYKAIAFFNLAYLYMVGLLGFSVHERIDFTKTKFNDGYWIRFVLEKK